MSLHEELNIEERNNILKVKRKKKTFITIDTKPYGGVSSFKTFADRITFIFKTGQQKSYSLMDGSELEIKDKKSKTK